MYVVFKRGIIPVKSGAGTNAKGNYSGSLDAVLEDGKTVRVKEIYYGKAMFASEKNGSVAWAISNGMRFSRKTLGPISC